MNCPSCGTPSENKRFCTRCGAKLAEIQIQAPPGANVLPRQSYDTVRQRQATDALTNRTLDQRYYLEAKLGVGGMGTVYRARRLLIGDTVAVKVLNPEQMTDSSAVERFRREAQATVRIKHPNVVTVYDFGAAQDGVVYLVMELVEGESLRQMIERQGTLIPITAAEVARQVCAALDEAHLQGVTHRDIKPENVLVQTTVSGLHVKVLDFGIAALLDITASKLTQTGNVVGTLHYMSPEQCMGEEPDGRSDIYSFGIVLYEMLTGAVPFDSPTATAIAIQHVNQSPPPMRALNANIPPEVEAVVLRALEKRREARPQTAGALARQLLAAVSGVAPAPAQPDILPGAASFRDSGAAAAQVSEPIFSNVSPASNTGAKLAPLIFGLLLLLAIGGGLGYWWYTNKKNTEQAAGATPVAEGNQQPSTLASDQSTPGRDTQPVAETKTPLGDKLWDLISDQTSGVSEAGNALGAPDQQVAVVAPGGQLALAYHEGQFFGDGAGADLRVFSPEQGRVSYTVFVKDDPASAWRRIDINRKGFPQGEASHDMGHHGMRQARQVMIRNDANTDLRLDAVSVVYKDVASGKEAPHKHH